MQEFSKFTSEGRGKLRTMVRNDFVKKSETKEDFVEEKGGNPFGGDGFLHREENYPLVSPWSTITRRESKPEEMGRSVMRLQEICWNG